MIKYIKIITYGKETDKQRPVQQLWNFKANESEHGKVRKEENR